MRRLLDESLEVVAMAEFMELNGFSNLLSGDSFHSSSGFATFLLQLTIESNKNERKNNRLMKDFFIFFRFKR